MSAKHAISRISTLIMLLAIATAVWAGDSHDHAPRAHEAHVHGVAEMTLVEDAGTVVLALEAPGMSLAGFEHEPKTVAEVAQIENTLNVLRAVDQIASIQGGDCKSVKIEASSSYPEKAKEGNDHDHETKHDHDHEEHDSAHSGFTASYQFKCAQPASISGVQFPLLKTFTGIEELNVQWIVQGKQGMTQISPSQLTLRF